MGMKISDEQTFCFEIGAYYNLTQQYFYPHIGVGFIKKIKTKK